MSISGRIIGSSLPWLTVALIRILPTLFTILIIAILKKERIFIFDSISLWLRSIFGTIALICTFYSLSKIPATETVTIFSITPIWVSLIMRVIFSKKVPAYLWLFMLIALLGVYILEKPQFKSGIFPIVIALFGSFTAGMAMVNLSFCNTITPLTVVSHYSIICTFVVFGLCFTYFNISLNELYSLLKSNLVWFVLLGISGTFGQILLTIAYGRGKPQWISLIGLAQVVFTTFIELWLDRIEVSVNLILGLTLVILSIGILICISPQSTKVPEI